MLCAGNRPEKVQAMRKKGRSRWSIIQEGALCTQKINSNYQFAGLILKVLPWHPCRPSEGFRRSCIDRFAAPPRRDDPHALGLSESIVVNVDEDKLKDGACGFEDKYLFCLGSP